MCLELLPFYILDNNAKQSPFWHMRSLLLAYLIYHISIVPFVCKFVYLIIVVTRPPKDKWSFLFVCILNEFIWSHYLRMPTFITAISCFTSYRWMYSHIYIHSRIYSRQKNNFTDISANLCFFIGGNSHIDNDNAEYTLLWWSPENRSTFIQHLLTIHFKLWRTNYNRRDLFKLSAF